MSLELTLFVLHHPEEMEHARTVYNYDQVEVGQQYAVLGQLTDLSSYGREDISLAPTIETQPLPDGVKVYVRQDDGAYVTDKDSYDGPLTFVYAKQLTELQPLGDGSPVDLQTQAVKAFVEALPQDKPIILWWH